MIYICGVYLRECMRMEVPLMAGNDRLMISFTSALESRPHCLQVNREQQHK
jgi:hypothetical protein